MTPSLTLAILAICCALAHGGHERAPTPHANDWASKHMAEEHHIADFDAGAFFNLHDYDSTNTWSADDIIKTYGLLHETNAQVTQEAKAAAAQKVIDLYDRDKSGTISYAEYTVGVAQGILLPDLGYGPGHHGDDEYEYEIHHFELFHDENTREEDLTHPEDIEHFRKHDMLEEQEERQEQMDRLSIVEANIPLKFRRS